jgi:hypothetical protein
MLNVNISSWWFFGWSSKFFGLLIHQHRGDRAVGSGGFFVFRLLSLVSSSWLVCCLCWRCKSVEDVLETTTMFHVYLIVICGVYVFQVVHRATVQRRVAGNHGTRDTAYQSRQHSFAPQISWSSRPTAVSLHGSTSAGTDTSRAPRAAVSMPRPDHL